MYYAYYSVVERKYRCKFIVKKFTQNSEFSIRNCPTSYSTIKIEVMNAKKNYQILLYRCLIFIFSNNMYRLSTGINCSQYVNICTVCHEYFMFKYILFLSVLNYSNIESEIKNVYSRKSMRRRFSDKKNQCTYIFQLKMQTNQIYKCG